MRDYLKTLIAHALVERLVGRMPLIPIIRVKKAKMRIENSRVY